jgi:predicted ABC-class ATPase
MQSKTGLVFDPAAMTRLADLIEEVIKEAGAQGIVIDDDREARRLVCKRVIAAIESGESDPTRLKQIAIATGLH